MINPLLAKLYGIILEKKINEWLEMEGKQAKGQAGFRRKHSTTDHLLRLGSLWRSVVMISLISCVALWTLENTLIRCLEMTHGIG